MPKSDQGINSNRYLVIPRTLIFLTRGDSVLLLKGSSNKRIWANRYNGIGGHIERGEDVLSAAQRELYEETGLSGVQLWLCGTIMVDASDQIGIGIFVFKGFIKGFINEGEPARSEEGDLEWVNTDDFASLPLVEDLPFLLPKVFAARPGDPPFAAVTDYDEQDRLHIRFA